MNKIENLIRSGLHDVTQGQVPAQDGGKLPEGQPFFLTGAVVVPLGNDRDHIKAYVQVSAPTMDECVENMGNVFLALTGIKDRLTVKANGEKSPLIVLPGSRN